MSFLSSLAYGVLYAAVGLFSAFGLNFYPQTTLTKDIPPVTPIHAIVKSQATTTKIVALKKSSVATTTAKKTLKPIIILSPPVPVTPAPTPIPVVQPLPPPPSPPLLDPEVVNASLRTSLVNILCTTSNGGLFRPISGSGIIIDTRGIILTNAHVAQFLLLQDYPSKNNIQCVVRTGSPAQAKYTAELLYVPSRWIGDNASQLKSSVETGTGENDYALLRITGTTSGAPLPSSFPAVAVGLDDPSEGEETVVAAYPAQFLGGNTIQTNLYASSAVTPIHSLYTFGSNTIDAFSVGSTVVSQSGSSGGAVARLQDGALVGIIATATAGDSTSARDLHAISLSYIDRSLKALGKGGLVHFLLDGDIATKAADFNANVAPQLTQQLIEGLK
jgi:hypothetical protein